MKDLMLHKIRRGQWEVWEKGDKESDDLSKRKVLSLVASRLEEQEDLSVLIVKKQKKVRR